MAGFHPPITGRFCQPGHSKHVDRVQPYADVLQVGSRAMHNTPLLKAAGEQEKPVLLKRGWSVTLEEFLLAAEYILRGGNRNVILCERGIRTHEEYVRNTLALAVVSLPVPLAPSISTVLSLSATWGNRSKSSRMAGPRPTISANV